MFCRKAAAGNVEQVFSCSCWPRVIHKIAWRASRWPPTPGPYVPLVASPSHCSPSARPSALLALFIPTLYPLTRADGPVGLPEHATPLIILPILLGTLVILVVPRVAVPSLVSAGEADIKGCRLNLNLRWGRLLLLLFFPFSLLLFRLCMHKNGFTFILRAPGRIHTVSATAKTNTAMTAMLKIFMQIEQMKEPYRMFVQRPCGWKMTGLIAHEGICEVQRKAASARHHHPLCPCSIPT